MSVKIDLLRHGELKGERVYCGVTNKKLTTLGWQQMVNACVKEQHWKNIVSSPLSRCLDFAKHLSNSLALPLQVDARWQEMNFGQWDGLSAQQIMAFDEKKLFQFWENPLKITPTDGESLDDMQDRILDAWQALKKTNQPTLVVTHGGPIRILCCHLENLPVERLFDIDVPYGHRRNISISNEK